MLKNIILTFLAVTTLIFTACTQNKPILKHQFKLLPEMIINESGCGYGTFISDEQNIAEPVTFWNGYDKDFCKEYLPVLLVDFLTSINITDIHIFSGDDKEITITIPGSKKEQSLTLQKGWNKIAFNSPATLIKISTKSGALLGEVLIDASLNYNLKEKSAGKQKQVLMQEFIGTNAFVDVPLGLLEPFGCIREYHDWPDWNEPQKDSFQLLVSKQGFDFESFYTNLKKSGKTVIPTLQKSPQWLTGESKNQSRPVPKGSNPADPKSYLRHALYLTKYAETFSSDTNGNIKYYENWNEPDKWWESGVSYFTPSQYASMSSGDKDGHLHSIGKNLGINTSGQQNKLVMAGLANPKIDYLNALKYWCDKNRNGNFPWEVINYHRYANSGGLPDSKPKEGICPESSDLYKEAKEIISFRDRNYPDVEVWLSEFGYDVEDSPQQSKAIGPKNSELVQADWLIRSYLILSAAGIDKAFQFMIRDFGKNGLYATSGLYSATLKEKPYIRPAWNYINTLKCALSDFYFEKLTVDSSTNIFSAIYRSKKIPTEKAIVLWMGTQNGSTAPYKLEGLNQATLINLNATQSCGENTRINTQSITVTETPVILFNGKQENVNPCYSIKSLSKNELTCKDLNGNPVNSLLDEQDENMNPLFGINGANPAIAWKNDYSSKGSNGIVFYLNSINTIHSILLFDGAGTGEIEILVKRDSEWKLLKTLNMNQYNKWKTVMVGSEVKEIKIVKTKGSPDIGEVLVYKKAVQ